MLCDLQIIQSVPVLRHVARVEHGEGWLTCTSASCDHRCHNEQSNSRRRRHHLRTRSQTNNRTAGSSPTMPEAGDTFTNVSIKLSWDRKRHNRMPLLQHRATSQGNQRTQPDGRGFGWSGCIALLLLCIRLCCAQMSSDSADKSMSHSAARDGMQVTRLPLCRAEISGVHGAPVWYEPIDNWQGIAGVAG
jgi:hypothetical protein